MGYRGVHALFGQAGPATGEWRIGGDERRTIYRACAGIFVFVVAQPTRDREGCCASLCRQRQFSAVQGYYSQHVKQFRWTPSADARNMKVVRGHLGAPGLLQNVQNLAVLLDRGERLPPAALEESLLAMALRDIPRTGSGAVDSTKILSSSVEVSRADAALCRLGRRAPARSAATSTLVMLTALLNMALGE